MFCILGVYEVNHSVVDVWIMLIMGVVGYTLRKFGFDPAPLVLGLVIAPIFEMSLRQSLIIRDGSWSIFFNVNDTARLRRRGWRSRTAARARHAFADPHAQGLAATSSRRRRARGSVARVNALKAQPTLRLQNPLHAHRRSFLESLVEVGDVFAIAVEQQRLACARWCR